MRHSSGMSLRWRNGCLSRRRVGLASNAAGHTRRVGGGPRPAHAGCDRRNTGGSIHFFLDGKHVLGIFQSGTGIVWKVDPAAWKAKACSIAHRNLTHTESTVFLGHRSYHNVCR
jgi:hypothetical protein